MVGDRADAMLEVMDEGMHEARHAGTYRRIEVITGRRPRRNWSDEEKARILAESAEPGVNISAVARRWGVNRGLLASGVGKLAWPLVALPRPSRSRRCSCR